MSYLFILVLMLGISSFEHLSLKPWIFFMWLLPPICFTLDFVSILTSPFFPCDLWRFTCSCGRGWPSNKVMVIFHMHLNNGMGAVKVRRLRQSCKRCGAAPMMMPDIGDENLDILLEKLVEQIRIKCYNEDMGERNRPFVELEVRSPHEPAHCEACRLGICDQ